MKKSLSSIEVTAVANELQVLVNSKISQIYHHDEELLFQLHVSNKGKQLLKIVPGKLLFLTEKKEVSIKPSNFCLQLRKYLNNAFVRKIYQKDSERIVVFELEREKSFFLIIELFAPGNLILTDQKYSTIAALYQQKFKDRFVRPKEKYVFPNPSFNWKEITESQLQKILNKSEKKNLATSLAVEIGLGGLYAEEVCHLAGIDKNKKTKEINDKEIKIIVKTIKDLLKQIEKPKGFVYLEQITPFSLKDQKETKKVDSYSAALDTLVISEKKSPYEKKIKALERIIKEQQEAVDKQEKLIDLNNQKAELIYQKYQPLQKLLGIVKELKKTKDWKEIKKELKKEKKIRKVDLKEKKIVVEL